MHDRAQTQRGRISLHSSAHVGLPLPEMQRVRFRQPHMPVNARAFVEPAITKARVHTHHQIILPVVVQEVSQIETEWRVAVVVTADEVSVEKNERAAERSVEFDHNAPARIFLRNIERPPVPANAGFRIAPSQRLVPVAVLLFVVHKRQLNRPVMRQIQIAPFRVVKLRGRKPELAPLCEISLPLAKSQIAARIGGVPLKKFPSEIKEQTLARRKRTSRFRRGIAREQCMCTLNGPGEQGGSRKSQAGAKQITTGE